MFGVEHKFFWGSDSFVGAGSTETQSIFRSAARIGVMCTAEKDNEELTKMYGLLFCWQGYDKDPGGFKKNQVVWDSVLLLQKGTLGQEK